MVNVSFWTQRYEAKYSLNTDKNLIAVLLTVPGVEWYCTVCQPLFICKKLHFFDICDIISTILNIFLQMFRQKPFLMNVKFVISPYFLLGYACKKFLGGLKVGAKWMNLENFYSVLQCIKRHRQWRHRNVTSRIRNTKLAKLSWLYCSGARRRHEGQRRRSGVAGEC